MCTSAIHKYCGKMRKLKEEIIWAVFGAVHSLACTELETCIYICVHQTTLTPVCTMVPTFALIYCFISELSVYRCKPRMKGLAANRNEILQETQEMTSMGEESMQHMNYETRLKTYKTNKITRDVIDI